MDFAFKRQDETGVAAETTKIVPLTCHGHSRPITHISFSPLLSPTGPAGPPSTTSSSAPQYYMISACKDNNPMLRDGLTGDWIGTFIGHKGAVWSARLSDDAALAATGSADFSAKVWDTFTGEALATLRHEHIVRAVAFPPGPRPGMLATGGMEKKLRVYDLSRASNGAAANGAKPDSLPCCEVGAGEHSGAIKSIIWSRADANILTTASDDKVLRWWDLRTPAPIATYTILAPPTSCELTSASTSPATSPTTMSVAAGKNLYFFDAARPGTLTKHISTPRDVASVALNGTQTKFVTGSPGDTWVRVWDYESEVEVEMGKGHHGPVWTTAFSPDGRMYATGSEDGTVKLWKFGAGGYGLWR
ncbi:hypothetical protein LTR08_003260 [Meristemomyces frigidus]|nr:hypothetical protein LTR08_003260 [Meristemomyces frigidus]